jgi:hypothetical protein
MKDQPSYSDNLDTIVALVTHLALTEWKSRTSSKLSEALGLEQKQVELVLENFKGLFRKSMRRAPNSDEHYYTLHMRYALRSFRDPGHQETQEEPTGPLDGDDLATLLQYISGAVEREHRTTEQEKANQTAMRAAWISATAAVVAAAVAVAVAAF